ASKLSQVVENVGRGRRRVSIAPLRHTVVNSQQAGARPDQVREDAEHDASRNRRDHRDGEGKTGCSLGIESRSKEGAKPRMSPDRLAPLTRRGDRRVRGRGRKPRIAPGDKPDDSGDGQDECEEKEKWHLVGPPANLHVTDGHVSLSGSEPFDTSSQ